MKVLSFQRFVRTFPIIIKKQGKKQKKQNTLIKMQITLDSWIQSLYTNQCAYSGILIRKNMICKHEIVGRMRFRPQ